MVSQHILSKLFEAPTNSQQSVLTDPYAQQAALGCYYLLFVRTGSVEPVYETCIDQALLLWSPPDQTAASSAAHGLIEHSLSTL